MQIAAVSVHDQPALERWYRPVAATQQADWPDEPGWALHELAARMRDAGDATSLLAVAEENGSPVGSMNLRLPELDNRHLAELSLAVHPDCRRHGVGGALLAQAEGMARARGRTTVVASTEAPAGSADAATRERFARVRGYEVAKVEIRRTLRLPLPAARLQGLAAARRPGDRYDIVTWVGPCPEQFVQGRLAVLRAMSTDAPQGDLELGEERWDADRLRRFERTVDAMGRDVLVAAAVHPDGELAGYTEIGVPRASPAVAYQFDTLVLAAHRGNGLGLRLKAANLITLAGRWPTTERVHTWNAETNVYVAQINEALGFVPTGVETIWQKTLT
jgi:GNAT superfamily N-acetyltransferase